VLICLRENHFITFRARRVFGASGSNLSVCLPIGGFCSFISPTYLGTFWELASRLNHLARNNISGFSKSLSIRSLNYDCARPTEHSPPGSCRSLCVSFPSAVKNQIHKLTSAGVFAPNSHGTAATIIKRDP
jgi:hypothetical protein